MVVKFKSKPMGCLSRPPRFAVLERVGLNGTIEGRTVMGGYGNICPQCRKPWSEHEGYIERPKEF